MESEKGREVSDSTDRLRELLDEAGLSQRAAARELEIDDRTMRYWCASEAPRIAILAMERFIELKTETE